VEQLERKIITIGVDYCWGGIVNKRKKIAKVEQLGK